MAASVKIPATFTARDRFSPAVKRMTMNVQRFSSRASVGIARVEHRFNRLMAPVTALQRQLGAFGLIGGLFLGQQIFKGITDFETGLVGVSKTTGIVGPDLDKLGDDFIKLSNSMRGVSTKSLLEVGQAAGQLGVSGSDNILKFSETMAMMEKATDVSGEEGASSIARLLTITGEGVGIVDQFGSALVGLGNNSAATESEILRVSSEVARGTAAYGLQSKEILGLSTALKSLDVRPEAAGTAVAKVFRSIEMATINGGESLQNFASIMGETSDQVVQDFEKNPRKAFTKFIGGLNRISNEGGSIAKALQDAGLKGETVSKGIVPLATNYDLLNEKLALSAKEFENNTALQGEYDAASKTVSTAIKDIGNSFTNLTLKTATAGSSLETLQNILFFVSDNMQSIVVVAATFIGAFVLMKAVIIASKIALAAYNVVMGISTAITQSNKRAVIGNTVAQGAYRAAMIAGSVATSIASAAQWVFAAAVNASLWPILLVIAAIAGIIAIIMNWSSITEWFSEKWKQFTEWISELWDKVVSFFEEFSWINFFKDIGNAVIDFMLTPLRTVLALVAKIPGKVGDMAQSALDLTGKLNLETDNESEETLPSTTRESNRQVAENVNKSNVNLNIRDKGDNVESADKDGDPMPVNLSRGIGSFAI